MAMNLDEIQANLLYRMKQLGLPETTRLTPADLDCIYGCLKDAEFHRLVDAFHAAREELTK